MAGGTVKCQFCEEHVPIKEKLSLYNDVKLLGNGKKKNNYYHHECYEKHLKKQAMTDRDMAERDKLDEYVKKIYRIEDGLSLPSSYWSFIGDLRNGQNKHHKLWKKKNKARVSFRVIKEAYSLSLPSIEWARMNKPQITQRLDTELRYGLVVVQSKLVDAYRKLKAQEQQAKVSEAMEKIQIEDMQDNREVSFQKSQKNTDYSYLLGDD